MFGKMLLETARIRLENVFVGRSRISLLRALSMSTSGTDACKHHLKHAEPMPFEPQAVRA